MVNWIRICRVDRKEGEKDAKKDEGSDPSMFQGVPLPLLEEGLGFPSF